MGRAQQLQRLLGINRPSDVPPEVESSVFYSQNIEACITDGINQFTFFVKKGLPDSRQLMV